MDGKVILNKEHIKKEWRVTMKSISMKSFEQDILSSKPIILDIREKEEYEQGHIPGALSFPLSEFPAVLDDLDKSRQYFVLCQGGGRSARGCAHMQTVGFNSTNVEGGMSAYQGPLER